MCEANQRTFFTDKLNFRKRQKKPLCIRFPKDISPEYIFWSEISKTIVKQSTLFENYFLAEINTFTFAPSIHI